MKNIIISALSAYIFYGFCDVKNLMIPVLAFVLVWVLCAETDEQVNDFMHSVKRGQKLNNRINKMKGVRF